MRPSVSRLSLALALCALPLIACSVLNGLDDLGAGGGAGGKVDSSTPTGPSSERDATSSGPIDSGSSVPDAQKETGGALVDADAGVVDTGPVNAPAIFADGGTTTWCERRDSGGAIAFCADFDRVALPSGFGITEGSYLGLSSTTPSSPANSLYLLVPPSGSVGTFSSKLTKNFSTTVSGTTLEFDFYPELVNTTSSGVLFAAVDFVGNASAKYSVRLAYNQGVTRVEESYLGFPSDVFHSTTNLPVGEWSRIRLELGFPDDAGAGGTIALYVNNALIGTRDPLTPPANVDKRPSLLMGAVYGTLPHTGWLFRYDNVTLDAQ